MKAYLFAAAALAVFVPTVASAQQTVVVGERPYFEQGVPAPANAFELSIGTGYTQPFGKQQPGVNMPDVAGAGIGFDLGLGYRIDPRWAVMIGGQYQELSTRNNLDGTRGLAGTLAAQLHLAPMTRLDPFVELGTGYRLLWEVAPNGGPTVLTHGWQVARVRAGFDLRLSPDIAVSPIIGADANVFLWQDAGLGGGNVAIGSPTVNTFVFAGVQGRFDIGGTKVGTASVTSAEPVLSE